MAAQPQEVREQIELEKRERTIVVEALSDEEFMAGVLEAFQLDTAGEKGEPWQEVKARLGIV